MCVNVLYGGISIVRHVGLAPKPTEVTEDFCGDWNMFPSSPMDLRHSSFSFFMNLFFYSLLTDSFVFFFPCFLSFAYFLGFGDIDLWQDKLC